MIQRTRGERNIAWIEGNCRLADGDYAGKPVKLAPFQKDLIKQIYDNPDGTRRVIISFGRKNGKTSFCAFLLLLHLAGPEVKINSELYSAAQSRGQAAILFKQAANVVRLSPRLSAYIEITETNKQLAVKNQHVGQVIYRALASEAHTAYGLNPALLIHDELGQTQGDRGSMVDFYEALESSTGAQKSPLSIIISTQAATDKDLLSTLIDDAQKGDDPKTVLSLHTCPLDDDPFSEESIRKANPAYDIFMNKVDVLDQANRARRMPSREPKYRNLILNQRVEQSSPFISRSLWKSCEGQVIDSFKGFPVYAGLDLSTSRDLTALVLVAWIDGKWQVKPVFWLPEEGLRDKANNDRVPYDLWARQGHLKTTPGKTVSYEFVASYFVDLFQELDIMQVAFDPYKMEYLKVELERHGLAQGDMERFVAFRQGFISMSPALRLLEESILNKYLVHDSNPVLNMCAANAIVVSDPAENRKLAKDKSRGRIDGMVALAMARAVAETGEIEKEVTGNLIII